MTVSWKPLKAIASLSGDVLPEKTAEDYAFRYVDIGNVTADGVIAGTDDMTFGHAPSRARKVVKRGDVIVSTVRTYLKAIASIEQDPADLVVSTGFAVLRPRAIEARFLAYAVRSEPVLASIVANSEGVSYPAIPPSRLMRLPVPVQPIEEQRAIVRFLDVETARIDTLIKKKQTLAELLKQNIDTIIRRTVLDDKDPLASHPVIAVNADLFPDKQLTRLGSVIRLQRGFDLPSQVRQGGEFPVISSAGPSGTHTEHRAQSPGVVTGRYGSVGTVTYVEQPYWPLNTSLYVSEFRGNKPRYIYYLLQALPLRELGAKSAVPGVDRKDIHALLVPRHSPSEQNMIVRKLDALNIITQRLHSALSDAIDRLREYRAALITAAVTGQIDVRADKFVQPASAVQIVERPEGGAA